VLESGFVKRTRCPSGCNLLIPFAVIQERIPRSKIRLIEGNAKCLHLKKLTCKRLLAADVCPRDFEAGVYLSEDQTPYPTPPPSTHCISVYYTVYNTYSLRDGGGRVEPERKLEGQQFT
jgi:hypothetical protein